MQLTYTVAGVVVFGLGLFAGWKSRSRTVADLKREVIDAEARAADLTHKLDDALDANSQWETYAAGLQDTVRHAQADAAAWKAKHEALILDEDANPLLVELLGEGSVPKLDSDTAGLLAALSGDTATWRAYLVTPRATVDLPDDLDPDALLDGARKTAGVR